MAFSLCTGFKGVAKINGVKISCEAGVIKGNAKYTAVKVPHQRPVFATRNSEISEKIGLPIKSMKHPSDKSSPTVPEGSPTGQNPEATNLHIQLDPKSSFFGYPPSSSVNNGAEVLVVRADEDDLLPAQMEVLAEFCHSKIRPMLQAKDSDRRGASENSKLVSDEINRVKFTEYFKKYCADKAVLDGAWADCQVPYLMEHDVKRHKYVKVLAYRSKGSS